MNPAMRPSTDWRRRATAGSLLTLMVLRDSAAGQEQTHREDGIQERLVTTFNRKLSTRKRAAPVSIRTRPGGLQA
jgi:hypothetical protein